MSFISYAQNFEDVMLWRALGHVENGFYIDVGAQHPINDSVSKAFYIHGWSGIHIEPVQEFAELLRKDRPDEIVLQVALSDREGILELNVIAETGLSTAVDAFAERHKSERGFAAQKLHVPVLTLKGISNAYVDKEVHWLKIDVEGLEENVLRGWDSELLRPWIIVVEATIPNSTEVNYKSWEDILIDAHYQFAYFDGLNRFYVAEEHVELVKSFSSPPNVFDRFRLSGLASSIFCDFVKAQYQGQLDEKDAELRTTREEGAASRADVDAAREAIHELDTQMRTLAAEKGELHQVLLAQASSFAQDIAIADQRLREKQVELSRLLDRSQWLENEWNASRMQEQNSAKILLERSAELEKIRSSTSWRLTAPLRKLGNLGKSAPAIPRTFLRSTTGFLMPMVRPLALSAIKKVLANPEMTKRAIKILNKAPRIKQKLRRSAVYAGLIKDSRTALYTGHRPDALQHEDERPPISMHYQPDLSTRANRILNELKKASEARGR